MADAPWFRFFPSDWLNGTRGLSLAQVGLYITLVAMMYDHGKPLTTNRETLARRCGVTLKQLSDALNILISEGKIIELPDGLWNERVSKEILARANKIQKAKEAAAVREEKKIQRNQQSDRSGDDRTMIDGSSILDSRYQTLEEERESCPDPAAPAPDLFVAKEAEQTAPEPKKSRNQYPSDFEAFWSAYPTGPNMSKVKAGEAWKKLSAEDRARAVASVPEFKRWLSKQKPDYPVVHAVRFITERRFDGFTKTAEVKAMAPVDWDARLKYAREHRTWSTEKWGPMPGQAGCTAPKDKLLPGDGVGWAEFKKAS